MSKRKVPEPDPKKLKTHIYGDTAEDKQSVKTPDDLYDMLDSEFGFDFDPCPYEMPEWDGLEIEWGMCNYVNPPYKKIDDWMEKAVLEGEKGKSSVFLVPVRPNTLYWKEFVYNRADQIRYIYSRVIFPPFEKPSPFPLAVIVFLPNFRLRKEPLPKYHMRLDSFTPQTIEQLSEQKLDSFPELALITAHSLETMSEEETMSRIHNWMRLKTTFNKILQNDSLLPIISQVLLPLYIQILDVEETENFENIEERLGDDEETHLLEILHSKKKQFREPGVREEIMQRSELPSMVKKGTAQVVDTLRAKWFDTAISFCQAYVSWNQIQQWKRYRQSYSISNHMGEYKMHIIYL